MSSKRRGAWYWFNAWWPVALGVAVVAIESEWLSSDNTSGPLRAVWQAIFGHVGDARWDAVHHYIRKTGHFTGYGLIGAAWLRAWWRTLPRSHYLSDAVLALFGTALMAASDEWHQSYFPDRTGTPWDVLLDCTGAFVVQLLIYLFLRLFRPKKLAHEE